MDYTIDSLNRFKLVLKITNSLNRLKFVLID